jgi:adenylate cyclase
MRSFIRQQVTRLPRADQLELKILNSELSRAKVMRLIGIGALIGWFFAKPALAPLFGSAVNLWAVFPFIAGFILYESVVILGLQHFLDAERIPPKQAFFINSLIETSIPSFAILFLLQIFDPGIALSLPPLLFYFVFILLSTLRLNPSLCVFTGLVSGLGYLGMAAYATSGFVEIDGGMLTTAPVNVAKAFVMVLCGGVAAFVTYKYRENLEEVVNQIQRNHEVKSIFGQHVSPAVAERLTSEAQLPETETKHVAIMFLDIRGFTAFSETHEPSEVVAFLNSVFEFMIEQVNTHDGVINKFLGDGFMAVFGAPLSDDLCSKKAIKAALAIHESLESKKRSGEIIGCEIGIGIHCGSVVTGNVGSEVRKEFTIIGDVVNVASRIEAQNKPLGTHILVSNDVWVEAGLELEVSGMPIEDVQLSGRRESVTLFQLK